MSELGQKAKFRGDQRMSALALPLRDGDRELVDF
jgi:hypothetical protein